MILALRQWGECHAFSAGGVALVVASGVVVAVPMSVSADGTPVTSRNTRVVHIGETRQ